MTTSPVTVTYSLEEILGEIKQTIKEGILTLKKS